jgi:hypothetical protein
MGKSGNRERDRFLFQLSGKGDRNVLFFVGNGEKITESGLYGHNWASSPLLKVVTEREKAVQNRKY